MQVQDVMTKQVRSCTPDESLEQAAQYMWHHDCGCLPVCQNGADGSIRTIGMITDRDICMCALFQRKSLAELRVSDAMANQVLFCQPHDNLEQAERIMRARQIRRLPVVETRTGRLLGLVSLADLARVATHDSNMGTRQQAEMEVCGTLASICSPHLAS